MNIPTYIAVFTMHGFVNTKQMHGEKPPMDVGFSIPSDAAMTSPKSSNKSLSIYFRLNSFDGRVAHYSFYGWRQMGADL